MNILVVDDSQFQIDYLRISLKKLGHQVVEALSAEAALRNLNSPNRNEIDLVLTDYSMPGMSGLELLSLIREKHGFLPVIMMSAFGEKGLVIDAMRNQCDGFLEKPFTIDQLMNEIKNAIEHKRRYVKVSERQLSDIINMDSLEAILDEVQVILDLISPDFNSAPVTSAFTTTFSLFRGSYPGFRACNTDYHDLRHTTTTFLTIARLIHGAVLDGETFTDRQIALGLVAALLHDTGYIQEEQDREGSGAKHTTSHVRRSINFLESYGAEHGLSEEEIAMCSAIILCTDLAVDISTIKFPSTKVELLGKMLGVADLLAQISDQAYLEKLLFLYHEFKEGNVVGYESEVDLLCKTVGFYDFISQRLEKMLDATDRYLKLHFASRWDIHLNLYHQAIEKQKNYLKQILEKTDSDPLDHLKRHGIVEKVRKKYGENRQ